MRPRTLAAVSAAFAWALVDEAAPAQDASVCDDDLGCWQTSYTSECTVAESTLITCLVFLQRLETARRRTSSTELTLLLGETLYQVTRKDVSPQAKERYLERSRAAYREVVRKEPLRAAGYLGLAEASETGEERAGWLRGAVQAEFRPEHMELLANVLVAEVGGHAGDLEAAQVLEQAYTFESLDTEKWRYGAAAWQTYFEASLRYPLAASERSASNIVIRIGDDIDYPLLQRALLEPARYLSYLSAAFATMCDKSIAAIFSLDECLAGLGSAVASAEASPSLGARRVLAEATLTGMRTIAGEALPRSLETQGRFRDWIDRLLATELAPLEVPTDLLEARADYTADLLQRAEILLAAIELSPNRGDLRLKLGAIYVELRLWPEALDQLRVAQFFVPPEQQDRVDGLVETADVGYQASFLPPEPAVAHVR